MTRPDEPRPDAPRADEPAAGAARPDDGRPGDGSVSAVLDGTATPAERDHVASSPELRARLEAFRAVRDGLRPVPGEAERLGDGAEDRIAAALEAWDPPPAADGRSGAATTAVVPATGGAEGRRARRLAWLGAAAALVLVAGIGVVVARAGGDGRTDQAATEEAGSVPPAAAEQDAGSRDVTAGADGSDPTTTAAAAAAPSELSEAGSSEAGAGGAFLGSFDTRTDLDRAALAAVSSPAAAPPACVTALAGAGATSVGTALLDGRSVVVGVTGGSSVVVLDAVDCTPVA